MRTEKNSREFNSIGDLIPDFYDEETIRSYVEDGLLSEEEEGFMIGYLAA